MARRKATKPPGNPRRRMRGLTVATIFVFSIFAAQLLRIQGFDSSAVAAEALEQRTEKVTIPALRGKISSSDGVVLASSRARETVVADPTAVCTYKQKDKKKCVPATSGVAVDLAAKALAPLLGSTADALRPRLAGKGRYQVLDRKVSPLTWRKIAALGIPGIYRDSAESVPERVYPQGPNFASLVGFVTDDGAAGGGLESMMDKALKGTAGHSVFEKAPDGSKIPGGRQGGVRAVDGKDITLTVNSNIQWYAQNAIAQQMAKMGGQSGTAVVMNAKTSEILALASYPTYDPNDIGSAKGSLVNKALNDVFEPGSTAKVMTIAAAIEDKKVTPDQPVVIPNRMKRYDALFKDSHDHPTLNRTVAGTLAESSNIGTILIGETLESKRLEEYFRKFGLGSKSGLGFPGESAGLLAPAEKWSGTKRSTVMFGQGLSVTAIQAASVFQTIANGGVRMTPNLIEGTTNANGTFTKTASKPGTRVVSQDTASKVNAMLEGVVSKEGTAPQAQIPGYRVAGKTGTADFYDANLGKYSGKTASFIGYAPADDPEIVVAVIIQRPSASIFGGTVAGPVFHDVMTYALQELKVPPTGTTKAPIKIAVTPEEAASDPTTLRDKPRGSGK
ncbi:putative cell division protein FtsI/penicillin-binding protein [Janibacter sp. HTCC2649]|uniref:peptidoglycan D,D-transpeptidase FtsI family protein n=1 Tax=Janibacter sp. HTCC2649 TaxID=313589 RepID=UPI000066EB48|nr:penicillin-binding protein 2 [Janibacter sp. HTCC2649]EAP98625.1 putative cell division protein FtsI/penicillin-binding protein [Janibacter sp. HTCC2649]